ncbi:MAG: NUDIX domain-containing protein [Myxococcota bacterium]|nr:NUDIX domain-containing protein [Myxococcota bacterium]
MRPLPAPPVIRLVVARDRTAEARASGGFLDVRRVDLVAHYPDGTQSDPFAYDIATRRALDAVVLVAHFVQQGVRQVFLRSAVRPPCALRPIRPPHDGSLWELPAGLVEKDEEPLAAAIRELGEELGFVAEGEALRLLGEWSFPAPGIIGERHVYYEIEVDPATRAVPSEDGSALERGGAVVAVALTDAIEHCRRGAIRDAKTEIALRRLAERLP